MCQYYNVKYESVVNVFNTPQTTAKTCGVCCGLQRIVICAPVDYRNRLTNYGEDKSCVNAECECYDIKIKNEQSFP